MTVSSSFFCPASRVIDSKLRLIAIFADASPPLISRYRTTVNTMYHAHLDRNACGAPSERVSQLGFSLASLLANTTSRTSLGRVHLYEVSSYACNAVNSSLEFSCTGLHCRRYFDIRHISGMLYIQRVRKKRDQNVLVVSQTKLG